MSLIKHLPHPSNIVEELVDAPVLPKHPLKSPFPKECPEGCARNCKQFFEAHTSLMSLALYATQDESLQPRQICVYAFSCGIDIEREKYWLEDGETMRDTVSRVVGDLAMKFSLLAQAEKDDDIYQRARGN